MLRGMFLYQIAWLANERGIGNRHRRSLSIFREFVFIHVRFLNEIQSKRMETIEYPVKVMYGSNRKG